MLKRSTIFIFVISQLMFGVTAIPTMIEFQQPDGTDFSAFVRGDEWQNWYENEQGYTISTSDSGEWLYVQRFDKTTPVLTQIPAHIQPQRLTIPKHLRPERFEPGEMSGPDISGLDRTEFQVPLLLIDYPDMPATYPLENFINLMNQEGYVTSHGETGSFKDFYLENSYGAFDPNTTIYGWFTASQPHNVYGDSSPGSYNHVKQMIRDAVDEAEAQGVDWTQFDNDGDGYVDALNVIHAGFGAEEGDGSNVWSHRWNLGNYAVTYDGVTIYDYTINPEKQGMSSTPEIVNIGVICHEFGHALGLPDLYDTDYSSTGIGTWGLMAGGSWGGNGNSAWYPAHMSAWCKTNLGWVVPIVITEGSVIIDLPNVEENPVVYKMNGIGPNYEYYLFENRQKLHFDQTLKNSGLMIWHVDESQNNNQNDYHYKVDLEQADGYFDMNEGRASDMSDPFPGSLDKTEFTDYSIPNSRFYGDNPSGVSVLGISENEGVITANFRNMPTIYINDFLIEEFNGDGDGVVNPDETAGLTPQFFNPSDQQITNLTAVVSTDDPDITLLTEMIIIADLEDFSQGSGSTVLFDISPFAELGTHFIQYSILGELENGDAFDQVVSHGFDVSINQLGFPYELGSKTISSPLVYDVDQDGSAEIIFCDYAGMVYVKNIDGTDQEGNWPFATGNQVWGAPSADDIDNDGVVEIIVNSKSKHLYILDPAGQVELDFDAGQFLVGTPALGNLDEDDDLEIVFGGFSSSGKIFAINPDGSDVDGFPLQLNEKFFSGIALADFNNNGRKDIVGGSDAGHLYLIYDDGMIAENFPIDLGYKLRSAPLILDLNFDSSPDILLGCDDGSLYGFSASGETLLQYDAGTVIRSSPVAIEDHGLLKLFFGADDGVLYGISSFGDDLFGWPLDMGQDLKTSPVFSDLDNDGELEIIITGKSGDLNVQHMDGSAFDGFPMNIGSSIECSPLVTDMDDDGDMEILTGYNNGSYAIDWKENGNASAWTMYRGNPHRTGFFQVTSAPVQPGDVNMDTEIDILDLVTAVAIILGTTDFTPEQYFAADMNSDGDLNVQDVVILIELIID